MNIPSPSRDKRRILEHVRHAVSLPLTYSSDEALLFTTSRTGRPLVLLAGHLDTVPAQDNLPGASRTVRLGLGASDMKGGVAVMVELAGWAAARPPLACDLGFLFFVREELPVEESALPRVFTEAPLLRESDLVVVLEPTDNAIHAGCLGNLNATAVFRGESAHSARPWQGVNAIDVAVRGLAPVIAGEPVEVEVGGLTFIEVLSATGIEGGIADNVIPDRVEVRLNYRYAPGVSPPRRSSGCASLSAARWRSRPTRRLRAWRPTRSSLTGSGGRANSRSSRSRRGRRWRSSPAEGLDAVNLGPGARATRTAGTSGSRSPSSSGRSRPCSGSCRASVRRVHVSPVLSTQGTYPFVRIERAKREAARPVSRSSTSARAIRASRPTR